MIDTDLFQVIALGLLALILLVLLIVLSVLNGIRKGAGTTSQPARQPADEGYGTPSYAAAPTATYGGATSSAATPAYGGSESYGTGGYTGSSTAAPAQQRQEVETSYVPVSQAAGTSAGQAASTPALSGSEPEEQPFERDGRWWFKRGGELLVYDEGTGQWVAAGATTGGAAAGAGGGGVAATPAAGAGETGEGWRCASCGAINGSTATVCRMCFTPRA